LPGMKIPRNPTHWRRRARFLRERRP
jgi:hypothetical protein